MLSNRADLISAGDALVAIDIGSADVASVKVTVGDRDVTDAFALRPNGRYEGLLEGLAVGENELAATAPDAPAARITIVNHPDGGPVFSGPQVQPWVCQDGARDVHCNQPETYSYEYRSSVTGQFAAYDPDNPPADVAQTTTDEGVTVPFVVRTETGYQDRDQYKIAVLFDRSKPWTWRTPRAGAPASCGRRPRSPRSRAIPTTSTRSSSTRSTSRRWATRRTRARACRSPSATTRRPTATACAARSPTTWST